MQVSSKTELESLYEMHFKRAIIPLSLHPIANYTVQTLVNHCPNVAMATSICEELFPLFEDLLAESATGNDIYIPLQVMIYIYRYR